MQNLVRYEGLRVNSSSRDNQELSYHNICSLLFLFRKRSFLHQAGLQMGKVRRKSGSQNTSWEVMQWLKHLSNRKLNRKVMWINNHLLFGPKVVLKYMYASSWSFCTVIFFSKYVYLKSENSINKWTWAELTTIDHFFIVQNLTTVFNFLPYFVRKTAIFSTFLFFDISPAISFSTLPPPSPFPPG